MRTDRQIFIVILLIITKSICAINTDSTKIKSVKNIIMENTEISGLYFMSYNYNTDSKLHNITLKRGYFTIKTKLNDIFSVRYTQDIELDEEGGDAGNVEMRLKYLYLRAKLDKINFFSNSTIEAGLVHRPWLDFEQHINQYRVQGRMYSERYNLFASADVGLTVFGLFGGKINKNYRNNVNSKEAGKYGSYAIGIFNGGGYHAIEQNSNKVVESRLSLRPFPAMMPGVQFSHGFSYGKSNIAEPAPNYMINLFMLSSESKYHKFTAQYHIADGNPNGSYCDSTNFSYGNKGYSFFGELLIPKTNLAVFSRYDVFDLDLNSLHKETFIAGIAYMFLKNKIVINYEGSNISGVHIDQYELALEISF